MKKSSACSGCPNYKGGGCFYILADKVELCPRIKKVYEDFMKEENKDASTEE
ncbi:MAG: hypothetical protein WC279_14415 [Sulfurimonas sp.]|jgi:hypothetical protein|uniref:hypothetical protein n=1 Tax=Sulfurimonas sp. TaxID=2022749 RepID=UPI003563559E